MKSPHWSRMQPQRATSGKGGPPTRVLAAFIDWLRLDPISLIAEGGREGSHRAFHDCSGVEYIASCAVCMKIACSRCREGPHLHLKFINELVNHRPTDGLEAHAVHESDLWRSKHTISRRPRCTCHARLTGPQRRSMSFPGIRRHSASPCVHAAPSDRAPPMPWAQPPANLRRAQISKF